MAIVQSDVTAMAPELASKLSTGAWTDIIAYVNEVDLTALGESAQTARMAQIFLVARCSGMSTSQSGPVAGWLAGARIVLIVLLTSRCGLAAPVDFYWDVRVSLATRRRRRSRAGTTSRPARPLAFRQQWLLPKNAAVGTSASLGIGASTQDVVVVTKGGS